jgi:hypothetical protein
MTSAEIDDVKARNPIADVAMRMVALRSRAGGYIGPCPICSPDPRSRTATRFEIKHDGWVCANCADGGDVIRLVMKVEGVDFKAAVEKLGGVYEIDPAIAAERERELATKKAEREKASDEYRQRERGELYEVWRRARPPWGTPVEAYLERRGLVLPDWPQPAARLRYVADMPYFEGEEIDAAGRKRRRVIGRWPAMVAPIVRDGRFSGLHYTYIDLAQPKGKAAVIDPDTGAALPSRKARGSKQGGKIELVKVGIDSTPNHLVIGEGIETVLSVWLAMRECGLDISRTEFWSLIDMGNIGGVAKARVVHPTAVDRGGRARRVPGPDPDLDEPGVILPPAAEEVVILGDGDSDPIETQCAMYRGAQRFRVANDGVLVRVAWAPEGMDFNDMLMEAGNG